MPPFQSSLLYSAMLLAALGLVMVASASMATAERLFGDPFFYVLRQSFFVCVGLVIGWICYRVPLLWWQRGWFLFLILALLLLLLLWFPGLGVVVNGSRRWLSLGYFELQVSEPVRLLLLFYLASYFARHPSSMPNFGGWLRPLLPVFAVVVLLLFQPDFGAAALVVMTTFGMWFLAGMRVLHCLLLWFFSAGALFLLSVFSPYRWQRIVSFLDPWADPFHSGFQLTQSLIAIGSGSWFGLGLGAGVQKLFYLPEAHTDFLFAVIAEELGLLGVMALLLLYAFFIVRIFDIARQADQAGLTFAAFLAAGIGLWLGIQGFINIGVNMGLLPTKGLTLPLVSYGGSSLLSCCMALGVVLRVAEESQLALRGQTT